MDFVGRRRHLADLDIWLARVASEGRGVMLAVRGRRQVGKSRLFTEFVERGRLAHVFFTAVKNGSLASQMEAFQRDALESAGALPGGGSEWGDVQQNWGAVFTRLRLAATEGPLVVVFDEFPWASEASPTLEGELQAAWDRHLQRLPILLVLIGSDVAMMERLTEHDRPLYGRAREMTVGPFNPGEVAEAVGSPQPMAAFDAFLVTGGYPRLVEDARRAGGVRPFVARGLSDENSDLVVMAQRSLAAEFAPDVQARRVLSAIGGQEVGHPTFSSVVGRLGEDAASSGVALTRALRVLSDDKAILAIDFPAGRTPASRRRRYRVADPYLRFWFRFVETHLASIARGRGDLAITAFDTSWPSWRGIAVEPVVREALARLAPSIPALADATDLGPWWNRDNSVEVDIVATAKTAVVALGSIKWRERRRFSAGELAGLAAARASIPHAGAARLIAVCPAGSDPAASADLTLTAADLLNAW